MKICIYGAGAVGGFLAYRLAEAGLDVSIIARGAQLDAIRHRGLTLETGSGRSSRRIPASADAGDLGSQDYVFLASKQHAIPAIAPRLAPLLKDDTAVVPAINGVPWWFFNGFGGAFAGAALASVDPDGAMARHVSPERVIGCVVHLSSSNPAPGVIWHGFGERFILGEPSRQLTPRLQRLAAAMSAAGLKAEVSREIQRDIWVKLWGNITFNPVSALTRATSLKLINDPLMIDLFKAMMAEVMTVGRAIGIEIGMTPEARIAIARELGDFKTSMLQDLEARRPLEIDGLIGVVVEIADRLAIPVPQTKAVLALVRSMAIQAGLYNKPGE